jgi:hypothetical protein
VRSETTTSSPPTNHVTVADEGVTSDGKETNEKMNGVRDKTSDEIVQLLLDESPTARVLLPKDLREKNKANESNLGERDRAVDPKTGKTVPIGKGATPATADPNAVPQSVIPDSSGANGNSSSGFSSSTSTGGTSGLGGNYGV